MQRRRDICLRWERNHHHTSTTTPSSPDTIMCAHHHQESKRKEAKRIYLFLLTQWESGGAQSVEVDIREYTLYTVYYSDSAYHHITISNHQVYPNTHELEWCPLSVYFSSLSPSLSLSIPPLFTVTYTHTLPTRAFTPSHYLCLSSIYPFPSPSTHVTKTTQMSIKGEPVVTSG